MRASILMMASTESDQFDILLQETANRFVFVYEDSVGIRLKRSRCRIG